MLWLWLRTPLFHKKMRFSLIIDGLISCFIFIDSFLSERHHWIHIFVVIKMIIQLGWLILSSFFSFSFQKDFCPLWFSLLVIGCIAFCIVQKYLTWLWIWASHCVSLSYCIKSDAKRQSSLPIMQCIWIF